jgi:hypothetical protein
MSVPKWKEVKGEWRKLHRDDEFHNLYSSPKIIILLSVNPSRYG